MAAAEGDSLVLADSLLEGGIDRAWGKQVQPEDMAEEGTQWEGIRQVGILEEACRGMAGSP